MGQVPVYGRRFTLALLRPKLGEHGLAESAELIEVLKEDSAFLPYVRHVPERPRKDLAGLDGNLDWSAFSHGMQVTISAGVATLKPNETPEIILARADSALYAAKAEGRNRIASA